VACEIAASEVNCPLLQALPGLNSHSELITEGKGFMPDVGLLSATEPVPADARVIIEYSVEVDGLPVYTETYDARRSKAS